MLMAKGLLALAAGVLTIIWPGITLLTLVLLFGAAALADGVSALILGIGGGWTGRPFARPGAGALAVVTIIGFYLILVGVLATTLALRLRHMSHVVRS
jgi:uncharacterized membrane protein HdeD (DUF308 family)